MRAVGNRQLAGLLGIQGGSLQVTTNSTVGDANCKLDTDRPGGFVCDLSVWIRLWEASESRARDRRTSDTEFSMSKAWLAWLG